jgi:LysR family transcriptional regulator (chromosome initiation inhibitor)
MELAPGRHLDVPLFWQRWRLDSAVLDAVTKAVHDAAATALRR